jgi:hypothetical protein
MSVTLFVMVLVCFGGHDREGCLMIPHCALMTWSRRSRIPSLATSLVNGDNILHRQGLRQDFRARHQELEGVVRQPGAE